MGEVGIANFGRDLEPPRPCSPEAGWVLSPRVHGKGDDTEAMKTVYSWLDQTRPDCDTTYCIVNATNAPSIGVARKLGFVEVEG